MGKDSIVYGIGGAISKAIPFLLLPVYTRIFTTFEYGMIEMLIVISNFIGAILSMGMDSVQSLFFYKFKKDGQSQQATIITSILQWRLVWSLVIIFVSTIVSPFINEIFFESKLDREYFFYSFVAILFNQIMYQSIEIYRLLYRPWLFVLFSILESFLVGIFILIMVLYFEQGVLGYFKGAMWASVLVSVISWIKIKEYTNFTKIHYEWWPRLLSFGAPLLPAGIALYFVSAADRWFIKYYNGEEMLGVYAVGAKFALIMGIAVETFRKAWWPIAMDSMHSSDGEKTFRTIAKLYMGIGITAVIYLTFFAQNLVELLTAPDFHDSWIIVGILAWQSLFYGFYMLVCGGIWKMEKTKYSMYLMIGAAIINIILNGVLVPKYGMIGAALATVFTYLIWILSAMYVSEKLWFVGYEKSILSLQLLLGGFMTFILIFMQLNFWVEIVYLNIVVLTLLYLSLEREVWFKVIKKLFK